MRSSEQGRSSLKGRSRGWVPGGSTIVLPGKWERGYAPAIMNQAPQNVVQEWHSPPAFLAASRGSG